MLCAGQPPLGGLQGRQAADRHLRMMAAATQADLSRFVQCRPHHGWRGAKELDSVGAQVFKRVDPLARLGWCGNCLDPRSEEHTSELQSLMRISYAVLCLKKKTTHTAHDSTQLPQTLLDT